ncbi:ComEA family DNA-binding protein [Atopomonas hussainii]|uniref:ComEA family DNA-binding protein n=1 Tax=Atopomonas hussainii TaxID=1429083 RepID=UPI0009003466|nr:ComEA family DNA-binding protein [Atopomonas hussainii]
MRNHVHAVLLSLSLAMANAAFATEQPVAAVQAEVATININTADETTLDRALHGVGPAKAQAIVAYRNEHGPFQTLDELLEVKGIGPAILENNRTRLSLK